MKDNYEALELIGSTDYYLSEIERMVKTAREDLKTTEGLPLSLFEGMKRNTARALMTWEELVRLKR